MEQPQDQTNQGDGRLPSPDEQERLNQEPPQHPVPQEQMPINPEDMLPPQKAQ